MQRYKSTYTGVQIDAAIDRALPGGEIDQMRPTRNLLDNWDFRNPVNQRGQTTVTAGSFLVDRWKLYGSGTVTLTSDGLVFSTTIDFGEQIEISRIPLNVPVTFSVLTNLGLKSITHAFVGTLNETVFQDIGNGIVVNIIYNWANSGTLLFCMQGNNVTVRAVKLELGSVSTLANDPPADHEAEKAKCKRYFNLWASEAARTAALLELGAMRTTPVLSTLDIGGVTYYTASADL